MPYAKVKHHKLEQSVMQACQSEPTEMGWKKKENPVAGTSVSHTPSTIFFFFCFVSLHFSSSGFEKIDYLLVSNLALESKS